MMELLVEAERYLSHGLLDHAERLFRQVAVADPKSSIAAVGLARVALERGDDATAYAFGRRALAIDPENPAAHHLVLRLEEVVRGRGEALPSEADIARITGSVTAGIATSAASAPATPGGAASAPAAPSGAAQPSAPQAGPAPSARRAGDTSARRPGLLGRLFDRRRRG
jgi:predicted Zn-dependent protease